MSEAEADVALHYQARERTATITMDDPAHGNALSIGMMGNLRDAFRAARRNPEVDLVVLQANGRVFCAGADAGWIGALVSGDAALWQAGMGALTGLLDDLHTFPKPVVARVQGAVVGGGVAMLCLCDAVIAAREARWRLPEVKLGMVPTAVLPPLQGVVPTAFLRRLLYEDGAWDSAEALDFGLATKVVDADALDRAVQERVAAWLALPAATFSETKGLLRAMDRARFQGQVELARPHVESAIHSADARERGGALLAGQSR